MTERKLRFEGHEAFNAIVRADWIASISQSPDAFQASLFLPDTAPSGSDDSENYEEDDVSIIDTNQDSFNYQDPSLVWVLDCPDEQESLFVMDDGGTNLGEGPSDMPLLLRIGAESVPVGAVLEWDEETATGIRTVWWYVQKLLGYGTANVGTLYACIPMRDFSSEGLAEAVAVTEIVEEVEEVVTEEAATEESSNYENDGVTYL